MEVFAGRNNDIISVTRRPKRDNKPIGHFAKDTNTVLNNSLFSSFGKKLGKIVFQSTEMGDLYPRTEPFTKVKISFRKSNTKYKPSLSTLLKDSCKANPGGFFWGGGRVGTFVGSRSESRYI